jgi:HNH endonuclease/Domain of unknown function (DUF222)
VITPEAAADDRHDGGVPAGTRLPADPTCHLEGMGGIERETARRLACDATVLGAVVDADGEVLSLGRSRRLVSRAQRRALMIRDRMCQFTGCHQVRHLEVHHRVPWSEGGPTDLDNLILLCQWHHTAVHEGGMRIVRVAEPEAGRRWEFLIPDGAPHHAWYQAGGLATLLNRQVGRRRAERETLLEGVDGVDHPDAVRIRPDWRGEPFDRRSSTVPDAAAPNRVPGSRLETVIPAALPAEQGPHAIRVRGPERNCG